MPVVGWKPGFAIEHMALTALQHPIPPATAEVRGLRVREIHYADPRYERLVASHSGADIFQNPRWLQVLEREYGGRPVVLGCEDAEGELAGVLPLFYTRGMPFGLGGVLGRRRLSSLPRTPVAGPLALHPAATACLLQALVDRVRSEPGVQLEIKTMQPLPADLLAGLTPLPWRKFYILDLPSRPEEIRFGNSNRHSQIRRAINKAVKQGLRPALAESEAHLASWYAIYARTMQRNGVLARSWRFFAALWETFHPHGLMHLWLARRNGRIVAGVLVLGCGRTAFYAFGGSLDEPDCAHANDLLHWEAIHEACRRGFRAYDFGEVPEGNIGLAQYKSKWNSRAVRLERYYYPAPQQSRHEPSHSTLHNLRYALWQRLPDAAATRLSDWLYSYL